MAVQEQGRPPGEEPRGIRRLFGRRSGDHPVDGTSARVASPIAPEKESIVLDFPVRAEPGIETPVEPEIGTTLTGPQAVTTLFPGVVAPAIEAPARPKPEEQEKEAPPSWLQRPVTRRRFIQGAAGLGAAAAIESTPFLRGLVNPYFERFFEAIGLKEPPVPPTFDNRADRGLIGSNNILTMSKDEVQQRFPEQIVAEGDNITFLFPFQPPEGGKIRYERASGLPALSNPEDIPEKDRERQAQAIKEQEEIKRRGIRSELNFVLPKDTVIVAPVGAHITIPKGRQDQFGGRSDMAQLARLTYYDKDLNITYVFQFVASGGATATDNLYPLVPLQDYKPGGESGTNWENLPKVRKGQPIVQTTKENQLVKLGIKAYRGKNIGPQAEIVDKTMFLTTPDFLTRNDGTGKEKLVVLQD